MGMALALALASRVAVAEPEPEPVPAGLAAPCDPVRARAALRVPLEAGAYTDAHYTAQAILAVCPPTPALDGVALVSAVALFRLEEVARARAALTSLTTSTDAPTAAHARVVLAWSFARDRDDQALAATLPQLPDEARARLRAFAAIGDEDAFAAAAAALPPGLGQLATTTHAAYLDDAAARRPWLAGLLSAVVPGAGQLYAGSWAAAGVSFVLNAVFITATVELAVHDQPFAASATGLAASFFYVGNIINAADLARRRGQNAAQPRYDALERALVPELVAP